MNAPSVQPALTLKIATTNPGKLRDFAAAASLYAEQVTLRALEGLDRLPVPVEDADTFAGNAILKALCYSTHVPGRLILADDSGIEVDALDGAPGVYSARFAEQAGFFPARADGAPPLTKDERNNLCLLDQLGAAPGRPRTARYRCVLAAARDGVLLHTASGTVEGLIVDQPRGAAGFGYDPLFLLPSVAQTMAEIDAPTRLRFSHRTRALAALIPVLLSLSDERRDR